MNAVHTEARFEDAVEASLLASGWLKDVAHLYRPELGLDTGELYTFIGATQPKEWERLITAHGGADAAQQEFAKLVAREIDDRGALDVLRHGVKDRGVTIRLAYFRPSHTLARGALDHYRDNRLTVVRQLHYSVRGPAEVPRPRALPQRCARCHGRAEEPADRSERRAREGAVPRGPGPEGAPLRPPHPRPLRGGPRPGLHHHAPGWGEDPVPAVQHRLGRPRPLGRCGQPTGRTRRLPDLLPVGAGMAAGRLARPHPSVPARRGRERQEGPGSGASAR